MKRNSIVLMLIMIVSSTLGFLRYIVLGNYYGASFISDAYLISLTIPLVIFQFIGEAITTTFIPIFKRMEKEKDKQRYFMNAVINNLIIIMILITVIAVLFAPLLVKIFATGFTDEGYNLAVSLTRITVIGIIFNTIASIFRGYLYSQNKFYISNLTGIPLNIIVVSSIILSQNYSIYLLGIGNTLAHLIELIILMVFAYKQGYRHKFIVDFKNKENIKMLKLSIPVTLGVSLKHINTIVDRNLASNIIIGGISALNYANRLNLFIQRIFVNSITTVLFPKMTEFAVSGEEEKLKKSIKESFNIIIILLIPIVTWIMIFAEEIVKVLFYRGEFDDKALILTSGALFFYSIGIIGFGIRELLTKVFYALGNTKKPMFNAGIALILNIILNFILSILIGIDGLALATSISGFVASYLLYKDLKKELFNFTLKESISLIIKVLIATTIMYVSIKYIYYKLELIVDLPITLLATILVGFIVYLLSLLILKLEEVEEFKKHIISYIKK